MFIELGRLESKRDDRGGAPNFAGSTAKASPDQLAVQPASPLKRVSTSFVLAFIPERHLQGTEGGPGGLGGARTELNSEM